MSRPDRSIDDGDGEKEEWSRREEAAARGEERQRRQSPGLERLRAFE